MVRFDVVVQVFAGRMFCVGRQRALPLQRIDRFRVGAELQGRGAFRQQALRCLLSRSLMEH